MDNKFLLFAFIGLGIGAIFLLTRRPTPQVGFRQVAGSPLSSLPLGIPVTSTPVTPATPVAAVSPGNVLYQNTETWDIDWNEDGLPQKVTIHRKVVKG